MLKFGKDFSEGAGIGFSIARGLLKGVGIGLCFTVAYFASALTVEFLNCFTGGALEKMLVDPLPEVRENLLHSGWAGAVGIFTIWSWHDLFEVASFFVISGGPVRAVYEFALQKQSLADRRSKGDGEQEVT